MADWVLLTMFVTFSVAVLIVPGWLIGRLEWLRRVGRPPIGAQGRYGVIAFILSDEHRRLEDRPATRGVWLLCAALLLWLGASH